MAPARSRWRRAGVVTAVAWFGIGAAVAAFAGLTGHRDAPAWLIPLVALVALNRVGTRYGIRGWRQWTATAAAAIGLLWVVLGFAACAVTLLTVG